MILRGIDFGRVWCASGARGFFGEGYFWHKYLKPFGLDWDESTFVAKTTTFYPCEGNMQLRSDFTPKEFFPDCVSVDFRSGSVLNAIGLSGPGANVLLNTNKWQRIAKPFFLSFMPVAPTRDGRLKELDGFIRLLNNELYMGRFNTRVGLQLNLSCPNTGHDSWELINEAKLLLSHCENVLFPEVPVVPKINLLTGLETLVEISKHPRCDAVCVTNTIPYHALLTKEKRVFGTKAPLAKYGGGGLSGKPIFERLISWLHSVAGSCKKPINAGGGILSLDDAVQVFNCGVDSIFLGSIAIVRPWRVAKIVKAFSKF